MARFSDDWEKEFRPSWSNVGSQLTALDPKQGAVRIADVVKTSL
jgi:hypothetical protein